MNDPTYALITPARNEAQFIERVIKSVIGQSILPHKWIIVNDGSTDDTGAIVRRYASIYSWIELLEMPAHREPAFAAKAQNFNTALEQLANVQVGFIANVDADVSFDRDYFAFILEKFASDPRLGVAGTPLREADHDAAEDAEFNETDVFGACQVFRRQCLENIGGYPLIRGGIDWAAVRMARMRGWKTRSFLEKRFFHHRPMGAAHCSKWRAMWNHGQKDYYLGNHPLWQVARVAYQFTRRPVLIRGALLGAGYTWSFLRRVKRPIPAQIVQFHRQEELQRLRSIWNAKFAVRDRNRTTEDAGCL